MGARLLPAFEISFKKVRFSCHKPSRYGVFVIEQRRRAEGGKKAKSWVAVFGPEN
jgi:hypothetical protein